MNTRAASLTLALVLGIPSAPLWGQPETPNSDAPESDSVETPPSAEQVAAAREHYSKGKAAQDAGDYDVASEEYLAAYEAYPQPLLLYNVAQAKRLGGARGEAIEFYEKYLELDPDGPGAVNSRELLAELRATIAEDKPPVEPDPGEEPDTQPTEPLEPEIVIPILEPETNKPTRKPASGKGFKVAGLSTAGVGLVAIGAGVFFGLRAQSKSDEISKFEGRWDDSLNQLYDDGESAERLMFISTSIGAAAVVTGGVLYFMGARKSSKAEKLQVGLTGDTVSFSIRGMY